MRVEDIDTPRVRAGVEARQLDDLRYLGLDWDEGPDVGGRTHLIDSPKGWRCTTGRSPTWPSRGVSLTTAIVRARRSRAWRALRTPAKRATLPGHLSRSRHGRASVEAGSRGEAQGSAARVTFEDRLQGRAREKCRIQRRGFRAEAWRRRVRLPARGRGRRSRHGSHRSGAGRDLLGSTARQVLLADLLGGCLCFAHHAMVVSADGTRLAKRDGALAARLARGGRLRRVSGARLAARLGFGQALVRPHRLT